VFVPNSGDFITIENEQGAVILADRYQVERLAYALLMAAGEMREKA